jgi:hypothetical protein
MQDQTGLRNLLIGRILPQVSALESPFVQHDLVELFPFRLVDGHDLDAAPGLHRNREVLLQECIANRSCSTFVASVPPPELSQTGS